MINSNKSNPDDILGNRTFDLVIDAVGKSDILKDGSRRLKPGGKIALYGVLSPKESVIDLLDFPNHVVIHLKSFPYREHACHDEIIEMILSKKINLKHFCSHVLPASEIEKIVTMTRERKAYKIVVNMNEI